MTTAEAVIRAFVANADFTRPAIDLIDELTEQLIDAGVECEKAADRADAVVMPRLI